MENQIENMDPNIYVVCDYVATGEGHSIMTLITRAEPKREDYIENSVDKRGYPLLLLETKNTAEQRALREFEERFGKWYAQGAVIVDRYEFFHLYKDAVPSALYEMCDPHSNLIPPGFKWYGSIHYNYS
jgi:hypothetical protein